MSVGIPPNPWPVLPTTTLVGGHDLLMLKSGWAEEHLFLGQIIPWSGSPGNQRAACSGQKKQLLFQMEINIQNQKIQLSSFRTCMLNYRPHLQEGWTDLPSSHQESRVVLVPGVPAATEEEHATPGGCPEETACVLPRGTTLPLPHVLATP